MYEPEPMRELTRIRGERGLTQQGLADASGVNKATINQIERGRRSPNLETLEKLAGALAVEIADFFPKVQLPLPNFEDQKGFDAWVATLEDYKRLRSAISNFEELNAQERRLVFEESWELLFELRTDFYDRAYARSHDRDWELALLRDALHQAVLRMVAVYELEEERGDAEANIVNIEEYKAKLRQSA